MAAGVKATVIGKPEPAFFREALSALECSPAEAVMIGDVSLLELLFIVWCPQLSDSCNPLLVAKLLLHIC